MIVNIFLAVIAYKTSALTKKGVICALILGIAIYFLSIKAYIILFLYFVVIIIVEKIVLKNKNEKRTTFQVLANSIFALIALSVYILSAQHRFFVIYCTMLSISMCDTIASTIGTRFAKKVYSITKFRQIERGVSGGVSFWGTVAGIMGSVVITIIYLGVCLAFNDPIPEISDASTIFLCGVFGMVLDSILGDLLQKKYYCKVCGKMTDNRICCDAPCIPIGVSLFTNSQINVISEGIIFVMLLNNF